MNFFQNRDKIRFCKYKNAFPLKLIIGSVTDIYQYRLLNRYNHLSAFKPILLFIGFKADNTSSFCFIIVHDVIIFSARLSPL